MNGRINIEHIKNELVNELKAYVDLEFDIAKTELYKEFDSQKPDIWEILYSKMEEIRVGYEEKKKNNECGELCYIYISYLRTSIVTGNPYYKIEFYDKRDRYSDLGGEGEWSFSYVYSYFLKIREHIKSVVYSQNIIKLYEVEPIIYELGERFHEESKQLLFMLFTYGLEENRATTYGKISIYLGEYMDRAELFVKEKNVPIMKC